MTEAIVKPFGDPTAADSEKAIERFGEIYAGSDGIQYLKIGIVGVRVDACKPFTGTVESFSMSPSNWHEIKLKEFEQKFLLHNNHVSEHGCLTPGEEVEGIIDMVSGNSFWLLRRVHSEEVKANI